MVERSFVGSTDIHSWSASDRLKSFENFDILRLIIVVVALRRCVK